MWAVTEAATVAPLVAGTECGNPDRPVTLTRVIVFSHYNMCMIAWMNASVARRTER